MKKGFLNHISKILVASFFVGSVALSSLNIDVFAARKYTETYDLNEDVSYTYKDVNYDGEYDTLIIEGDGPMPTFQNIDAPWYVERHNIIEVIIEDGIKSVSDNAFYMFDMLEAVSLPDSVRYIGEGAFYKCVKLQEIRIPSNVTVIKGNSFSGCYELESVTIPEDVTEIEGSAFSYCLKLKRVTFAGDDVEVIGSAAFFGCSKLEEIEIPNGVERIKENAFNGCKELTKITIPKSVERIDTKAFSNCTALRAVEFDCRTVLEYDEEWDFNEKYFILDHNYKNGVCTVCGEDEDEDEDDSDDNSEYVDWEYIIENTENTFGTTTYDTKLSSKDTTVPYDVFDTLKGKKAVLNIKVNDIFSWSIKSGDIKTPKKLDLGVKLADKSIPLAVMSEYTKDYNYKELELSGSGDFGLKAQLTIDVGTINNGNKVDLYYYDPDDADSLEFIASSKVENGKVTLPFTHASRYVIDMYKEKANDDEDDDDDDNSFGFDDFAAGESLTVTEIIL